MRLAVVYHPGKTDTEILSAALERAKDEEDVINWYPTAASDAGVGATEQAVSEGADVVLASGGDGTIRVVAGVLAGTDVALAICPQGTGNILARNIGVPLTRFDSIAAAALHGRERHIDIGYAEIVRTDGSSVREPFLVLAGIGLDARMIAGTDPALKKNFGWLAYVDSGMRSIRNLKPFRARAVTRDAEQLASRPTALDAYTIMIGNCGVLQGGILLIPDATIDDGLLDVVAMQPEKRWGVFSIARIARRVAVENKLGQRVALPWVSNNRTVTYKQVRQLELEIPEGEAVQLDGDDFGEASQVRFTVSPAALKIRVLGTWEQPVDIFTTPLD
ncbi:diacylglycerol/lipid kinase family protein [Canibacter zhoujuaniae]|uniref:diacylglycerol/lipid kinase family protein n=1 Tax=Canibacter zhoujuaniae TaxID=2708343 RepID=UPI0014245501|nr:diacylglycerol kinase family protein [Canibacter zhoujuaniae]